MEERNLMKKLTHKNREKEQKRELKSASRTEERSERGEKRLMYHGCRAKTLAHTQTHTEHKL